MHAAYGTVTLYESSWWPVGSHCANRHVISSLTDYLSAGLTLVLNLRHLDF